MPPLDDNLLLLWQILPDGDLRPQAKHLQSRAEYLLRVLRKQITGDTKTPVLNWLFIHICDTWFVSELRY